MSKNDGLMVVGTLFRKAPSRREKKVTEADIVRKDMLVSRSYADGINEDTSNLDEFHIDDAKTEKYYKDAAAHKKELDDNRKKSEMASTDVARQLINMASGVGQQTASKEAEEVEQEDDGNSNKPKEDSEKDAEKEERAELFKEAKELGLTVAKNIQTDKLKQVINATKED